MGSGVGQDPAQGWRSPSGEGEADAFPGAAAGRPAAPDDRPDLHKQPPAEYAPPSAAGYPPQYGPPQHGPAGPHAAPYASPYGGPLADKPGVIPLRPLAVGEILDGAFATIRSNVAATLGLTFLIVLVGQVVLLAVTLAVRHSDLGTQLSGLGGATIATQLISTVATGTMIVVIGEAVLGNKISPGEALERLRGRIWRLIGLSILVLLLSLLGLLLIVIGYIWVAVVFSLAAPVLILEKTTVRDALGRSYALVRGSWWRTLGIGFLGYLVGGIVGGLIQLPFSLVAGYSTNVLSRGADQDISTGNEIVLSIGHIVGGTVSTPIIAGTIALIYVDRRMRREGLDLVLAQAARERRGRP